MFNYLKDDPNTTAILLYVEGLREGQVAMKVFKDVGMKKPIIASVQGAAAGFGLSLVMACDLAIAADNAFFTLAYIGIATTPDGSGSYSLPRIVGKKRAMEIAMLGDRFDAHEDEHHRQYDDDDHEDGKPGKIQRHAALHGCP